jgi:DNA-binding response OmpR family regulator
MSRIILADDDAWLTRTLVVMLTRRGHQVEVVGNGREALDAAISRPPDLVITDVMMPILDGLALAREMRARPQLAHIPIIMVSALASSDDRIRGFQLGADDYIGKPFRFEEVDLRVTNALRRAQVAMERLRAGFGAPILDGHLAEVSLATVLGLVEREHKTGRLTLRDTAGGELEILIRDGFVVQATIANGGDLPVVHCIRRALAWRDGTFRFVACDVDATDDVQMSTTHLLLESARLGDEATR